MVIEIKLHPTQAAFRNSTARNRGFVGGIGSGKSWIGAYDMLRRARARRLYMVAAPTFGMLGDATWRTLRELAEQLNFIAEERRGQRPSIILGNGAEILGRSTEDPGRLRGPNLSGIWLDEASQMKQEAFEIAIGRLREKGEQGFLTTTFTPKGKSHWTFKVFGEPKEGTELFHASTRDNPFLPPTFFANVHSQYAPLLSRQELCGEFVHVEGAEFPGEWFDESVMFSGWPSEESIRFKVVALDPSIGATNKADYSAFVKLALDYQGTMWIECDMDRRDPWKIVSDGLLINRHFRPHRFGVEANQFQAVLAGIFEEQSKKEGLMLPLALVNQVENKRERIRRDLTPYLARRELRFKRSSPGTELLLDQLRGFPIEKFDDGPDALQQAICIAKELYFGID